MDLPDARTQGLAVAVGQQDIAWSMAFTYRESVSQTCSMEVGQDSRVSGTAGQEAARASTAPGSSAAQTCTEIHSKGFIIGLVSNGETEVTGRHGLRRSNRRQGPNPALLNPDALLCPGRTGQSQLGAAGK